MAILLSLLRNRLICLINRYDLLVSRSSNRDNRDVGVAKGKLSANYSTTNIFYARFSNDNVLLHDRCGYGSSQGLTAKNADKRHGGRSGEIDNFYLQG